MTEVPPSAPLASVGIVGLGLMGGSLALALSRVSGLVVLGMDTDPRAREAARVRGLSPVTELAKLAGTDVIVVAVPLAALPAVFRGLARIEPRPVVTDMSSTKRSAVSRAAAAGIDLVAGHPMCGRERGGIEAADADLYRGAPWLLDRPHPVVERMVRLVGGHPIVVSAPTQDELVAAVSHAAHLLSAAYTLALARSPAWQTMAALAGPGFRDMSRLAAGDPDLYSSILIDNSEHVLAWLDRVSDSVRELRQALEADPARLREALAEAAEARRWWAEQRGAHPSP